MRGLSKTMVGWSLGVLGVLVLVSQTFFYADPGHSYLVQYPWGPQKVVMEPGLHPLFFGRALAFKKVVTVRLTDDKEADSDTATDTDNSVAVRWNDSVRGNVSCASRFRLPEDPALFQ